MKGIETENQREMTGIVYAVMAYTLWGLLPLYWKLLDEIPADEIFAHRILWSFIFVIAVLCFSKRLNAFKDVLTDKKSFVGIIFCALLISANWYMYIWAVNANHVVEASMGYYINPLVVVLLAMIVFKEKLSLVQGVALILAAIGVIIIAVQYGKMPWVALGLAITFAFYGLFKKMIKVESMLGLAIETSMMVPIACIYIILKEVNGIGALGTIPLRTMFILVCSGIATATPLFFFAKGAQRIPFTTLGFIQYISPTISLFLGVFVFKEAFTMTHFISFGFIWCGLILYSLSQTKGMKGLRPKYAKITK